MTQKKSLGLVQLEERTIEHDFNMLERFQDFSAELLRLALLGITAIGFGASKVLFPEHGTAPLPVPGLSKLFIAVALLAFSTAAAGALLHRYSSADSMSWHIQAMRRYVRGEPAEVDKADSEARLRAAKFKVSRHSLAVASASLALGATALAVAVWLVL